MAKIKLGISSCLLGEKVRYDGGHKLDRFLTDTLSAYVEYVPVCPEVEADLGVPRESMRLEGDPARPKLLTTRTRQDITDTLTVWALRRVDELEREDLCGFIFKSDSPSSGMERVKVYSERGMPVKSGVGIFARIFMQHFPLLPVEDEGRLHDPDLRENFIERIFALKRWRELTQAKDSRRNVIEFHTNHKLQILAHSIRHYHLMGKLVAGQKNIALRELYSNYESLFMEALKLKATPKKNTNVLQHMMGYFKELIASGEKQELLEIIRSYQQGYVPLIVPVTLINHYVRKYDQSYLRHQVYLHPHPVELQLRNHV